MTTVTRILARLKDSLPVAGRPRYVGRVLVESYAAAARDPYVRDLVARVAAKRAAERKR